MEGDSKKDHFVRDIDKVMLLVEQGKEMEARFLFNDEVYKKYKDEFEKTLPMSFFDFFNELDEYLNNDDRRALGNARTRDEILDMYKSEFQEDVKKERKAGSS